MPGLSRQATPSAVPNWCRCGPASASAGASGAPHEGSPAAAATPTVPLMARRFRGFLPVVIDVETGGFESRTDALLQIAAVLIDIDAEGHLRRGETHSFHVK